jgi:protein O-GlcNAc transferase
MGNTFQELGKLDDAVSSYQKAISLNPNYVEAHNNLGHTLQKQGRPDEAAISYQRMLELRPNSAETYNNLGVSFHSQGKLDEATVNFHRAIKLKPDRAEIYNNLASVLLDQGKVETAIENCRKALSLKPNYTEASSNLLFAMTRHSGCSPAEYLVEARRYGDMVDAQANSYTQWAIPLAAQDGHPLRVGLVSGDLRAHPVGFFLENILTHLDPSRLELVAYVTDPREDMLTSRIKSSFSAWNYVRDLSDEVLARKIHKDGIHILIDMAGHTAGNRLPVFAWKPAPVQLSWLGYWASTGVPGMDYLLADRISVPESHQAHFTETIWYLPDTRLCFTPPANSTRIPLSPLPRMHKGYITFGSFQKLGKINEGVLALWSKVFCALPDARLRLQNGQMNCPVAREQIRDQLAKFGIAPERVTLEKDIHREGYLAAYDEVDIILDTFPFPGGTTTCEALWMGVPTLTLAGNTLVSRQGVSILACAGLEEWIAGNEDDFVARAVAYATDVNRLAQLRTELRQKVLDSPLFDGFRFARQLENALQNIWQHKILSESNRE